MNKKQIANLLRDYHWIVNEIARQRKFLEDAGEKVTAQYGIEAAMPKGNGGNSDPVSRESQRREKKYGWIAKLERKATYIQERQHMIQNEREKAVLECLMDGMSMIAISRHMGLSERHVYILRDRIIERIAGNAGNADFTGKLHHNGRCG